MGFWGFGVLGFGGFEKVGGLTKLGPKAIISGGVNPPPEVREDLQKELIDL